MLNVHEMNVFLVAAETQNFSEAARQLHMTQPAVSMQIQALEQRLGVNLFERSGRRIQLSEAGETLMPMARELVGMSLRIEETMKSLGGEVVGHLKIGCSTTAGKYILPQLIARFRREHPRVQVTVYNNSRDQVMDMLCEGMTHISVISSLVSCRDAEFKPFFTDRAVLIVPVDHPWADRGSVSPHELCEVNFIMRDDTAGTRQVMMEGLIEHGIHLDDLNVVMELGSAEAIEMAVEEGIGVSIVSRLVAQRGVDLGRIKVVDVEGLVLERKIYMAYNIRRPATNAQSEFWNFVHQPLNETLLKLAA
ncbi:MAG: selenium metabolism-associated LysR family transcriptional regulator [Anaerolineae bacterium]